MLPKEYFTDSEVSCRCGCGKLPDQRSLEMLYVLRIVLDFPLTVNSGARCAAHNASVGGSENSTHMIGAFDIAVPPDKEYEFIEKAIAVGFTGIGIHDNTFIHIDRHRVKRIWTY